MLKSVSFLYMFDCRLQITYILICMFIPCSGSELRHVPFVEHWRVTILKITPYGFVASMITFRFDTIPHKLNQQKHTLFSFGDIVIAWYDTLQNKACHVLRASVHCIFPTWFWYLFCTFYNVLEKLVFGSGSFYQTSHSVEDQLFRPAYFGVPPLF